MEEITTMTSEILNEFKEQIDEDKVYDLKEMTQILKDIYNTKMGKKATKAKKPKEPKAETDAKAPSDNTDDEEEKPKKRGRPAKAKKLDKDGNPKEKRAPTAYNKFMSMKIKELKQENEETAASDLMKMASAVWKEMSQEEKDEFK